MKSLPVLIISLFFSITLFCQDSIGIKLLANFHQIKFIDPQQTEYSDLEIIGNAIGNSRIVFLGEQDHGDAPTFLAKTRLIKYLHEIKGFDVLVFEGDFWGLNEVNDKLYRNLTSVEEIKTNTYDIWAKCLQTQELYQYIKYSLNTNSPIIVSGIDCRHSSKFSRKNYTRTISSFLISQTLFINDTITLNQFLKITDELIKNEYESRLTKEQRSFFFDLLDKLMPTIKEPFWRQEFINLKYAALNSWGNISKESTIRDVAMADNLLWLYRQKYFDKKIIVWAHSAHIAKNIADLPKQNKTSLGTEIFRSLKDSIYILGFSSLTGRAGSISVAKKFDVEKAKPKSFEDYVGKANFDYGFINFRIINTTKPFYMKALDHKAEKADWTKVFDGVFYIKTMYPCDKTE